MLIFVIVCTYLRQTVAMQSSEKSPKIQTLQILFAHRQFNKLLQLLSQTNRMKDYSQKNLGTL